MQLFDDQTEAINKLHKYKVGALFMDPGTGKTLPAYKLVESVHDVDYILWLTPFQTKNNLSEELAKYSKLDIDIVGIESLSNSNTLTLELYSKVEKAKKPFIVVDESLKIKNWNAKRTKRIVEIGRLAEYKLILNGTPLSRNLLDLWAQMEFLSPKILNMGIAEYKNTFCEYTRITKRIGNKKYTREFINKYHNVDYLYSRIQPYVYEAELNLATNKQYINIDYIIDEDKLEEYYYLKEKYLDDENLKWIRQNIFLELTQKMQHSYCSTSNKIDVLNDIVRNNPANEIIVFTKFIESKNTIEELFPDLTVLSYGKHALGLNLQNYNITVFFDKTWDYAQRLQAEQRTYRTGQTEDCIYYDLTGNVGLEKMIDKNIMAKIGLLDYFKEVSVKQLKKEL